MVGFVREGFRVACGGVMHEWEVHGKCTGVFFFFFFFMQWMDACLDKLKNKRKKIKAC